MAAAAAVTGGLTDVRKLELTSIPVPADDVLAAMIRAMERQPEKAKEGVDVKATSSKSSSAQWVGSGCIQ